MKKTWMNYVAFVIGLLLGPSSLNSVKMAKPPIDWAAIPFILIGCIIAVVFVVGIQVLRKNPKYGHFAILSFTSLSLFVFGSGVGALVVGSFNGEYGPSSFVILSMSVGLIIGLNLIKVVYRVRFNKAL